MPPSRGRPSILGLGIVTNIVTQGVDTIRSLGERFLSLGKNTEVLKDRVETLTSATGTMAAALGAAFLASSVALTLFIASAAQLEEGLANIRKTTGGTTEQIRELRDEIIALSLDTPLTAKELAQIGAVGGQLGIQIGNSTEPMEKFIATVQRMAVVTEFTAQTAAEELARINNLFQLPLTQVERLGSAMNELANKTTATTPQIADITRRIGPMAVQMGITVDQALALSATLRDVGLTAQLAGTNLTAILARMARNLSGFATQAQVPLADFRNIFETNAVEALKLVAKSFEGMNAEQASKKLVTLGLAGERVSRVMLALSRASFVGADGVSVLDRNLQISSQAFTNANSLIEEFTTFVSAFTRQLAILRNRIVAIAIKIGQGLLPPLKLVVQGLSFFAKIIAVLPQPVFTLVGVFLVLATAITGIGFALTTAVTAAGLFFPLLVKASTAISGIGTAAATVGLALKRFPLALSGILGPLVIFGDLLGDIFAGRGFVASIGIATSSLGNLAAKLRGGNTLTKALAASISFTLLPAFTALNSILTIGLIPSLKLFAATVAAAITSTTFLLTLGHALVAATGIGAVVVAVLAIRAGLKKLNEPSAAVQEAFERMQTSSVRAIDSIDAALESVNNRLGQLSSSAELANSNLKDIGGIGAANKFRDIQTEVAELMDRFNKSVSNIGDTAQLQKVTGIFNQAKDFLVKIDRASKGKRASDFFFFRNEKTMAHMVELQKELNRELDKMIGKQRTSARISDDLPEIIDERFKRLVAPTPFAQQRRQDFPVPARAPRFTNQPSPLPPEEPINRVRFLPGEDPFDVTASAVERMKMERKGQETVLRNLLKDSQKSANIPAAPQQGQRNITVQVPLLLDGREIGRAVKEIKLEDNHRDFTAGPLETAGVHTRE